MTEDKLAERVALVKANSHYDPAEDGEDRLVLSYEGFTFGDRVRVIDDDEENGLYADEEGYAVISKAGAAEYRNVRTVLAVLVDGTDCPMEAHPDNLEAA